MDYLVCVEVHDHILIDVHVHVLFLPQSRIEWKIDDEVSGIVETMNENDCDTNTPPVMFVL